MSTQPTDEEIDAVTLEVLGYAALDKNTNETARLIASAVLAKWGPPAQAAEPFCWHWENTFNGGMGAVKKNPETLGINMSHPDYKWTALYTAQPPTHAQAGAREQLPKFLALKFHARRDKKATVTLLFPGHEAADAWVRGIKAGQHGAE